VAAKAEVALPEFQGGDYSGFKEWLFAGIVFPEEKQLKKFAKEPVSIIFEIDPETAKTNNIELISYPDEEFAMQVGTLIERSSDWSPASSGESVRFYLQVDPFTREIILMPYILSNIETPAVFQGGGVRQFNQSWIIPNLVYPREALMDRIRGRVEVTFYVDILGRTRVASILSSPHKSLTKETERVIETSPPWEPATMNGIAVPFLIPLATSFEMAVYKEGEFNILD
jgi:TonB family protein